MVSEAVDTENEVVTSISRRTGDFSVLSCNKGFRKQEDNITVRNEALPLSLHTVR